MATVTLRPDGTVASTLTAVVGAPTPHAALSDNSDASYVLAYENQYVELNMTTVALPAGAVVKQITPRVRGRCLPFIFGSGDLWLITRLGGGLDLNPYPINMPSTTATVVGPTDDATYFTPADLDGLTIGLNGVSSKFELAELYLDVVYLIVPVVAATAPTGVVTTTTSPVVAWTYSQADNGPQVRYQVRIFNAAQYGAVGFNPTVSPAAFDTGERYGSNTSTVVGPLSTPVAYRSYVRSAQLVGNIVQWSSWSYTSFSLAVAAPAITSVIATTDSANGRNRIVVTRNAGSAAWTGVDVERSADGGITWRAVRGATNASPSGDVWIGYDYEAGNGVSVIYRARGVSSIGPVAGAFTLSTAVAWSAPGVDWLKDLNRPALSRKVTVETQPSVIRSRTRGIFRPVGRPDPVIVSDVRQLIVGEMSLLTATDAEADDLNALLGADVLLFQSRPGERFGSRYLSVGDVEEVRDGNVTVQSRTWLVPFVEVLPTVDTGIVVPGITWADVVATYPTWTALLAAKPTWGDLV